MKSGNIEYGLCQALHGEESAVAALRSFYGRTSGKEVIHAIVAGNPGNIASPCGNCRDIMLEDLGESLEIVCGTPEGGIAVVATMEHYLFSEFRSLIYEDLPMRVAAQIEMAIQEGDRLVSDPYAPSHIRPERRYHALIQAEAGVYCGGRDVKCEYHPIYALRDAQRAAGRACDPFVRWVLIVCEDFGGGAPHVMYKDRQHLLEFNLEGGRMRSERNDPPVYLVTYSPDAHHVTGIWQTSVKEWLPYPFTPENFGEEFMRDVFDPYHRERHKKNRRQ